MNNIDKSLVLALAESRMQVSEAARRCFVHKNTALYRIKKIKKETALDTLNFYDLGKLVNMVEENKRGE